MSARAGDHRLLIGASLIVLVHVLRILLQKLQNAVLDSGTVLHPFLRTFIKSCSMTVFLLKLAADAPWTLLFPAHVGNGAAVVYSSLSQDEEEGGEGEERVFDQSDWVPVRHEGSDEGSDRSSGGSLEEIDKQTPTAKKRSKVRFSKFSEVRTMTSSDADAALFARLSYQASLKAEAEAAKAANRLKPFQMTRLALKLSFIHFSAHFLQVKVVSEAAQPAETMIFGLACVVSLFFLLMVSNPAAESDQLTTSQVIACVLSLVSMALATISLSSSKSLAPIERLEPIRSHAIEAILSAALHAAFVLCLRREVVETDRLDIPLFMGLMGFFQVTLAWPGFFFLESDLKQSPGDSWSSAGIALLGDIVFTSLIELLWIWSCLSTSVLITFVSLLFRLPLSIIMSAFISETTFGFWMGLLCLLISFMILVTLTNWKHLSFSQTDWSRVSQDMTEEHYVLTQDS